VLYRLHKGKHDAFLVGGAVRDLLLNLTPKDYDVATNAKPKQIQKRFQNCRLIGRRFVLAHIHFGKDIIEVATFRGDGDQNHNHMGMITHDNHYGTLSEDAFRRDLTINALYYNIADFSIIDLVGGVQDIQDKIIRIIGDPKKRYNEDPVRMLRVVRLAAKLNFTIEPKTAEPIKEMAPLLQAISHARLFDENVKLFHKGAALNTFRLLKQYDLFQQLFPQTHAEMEKSELVTAFIEQALSSTDTRIAAGKTVTPAFLLAVFLWHPLLARIEHHEKTTENQHEALQLAMQDVLGQQIKQTAIPKFFANTIKDIWHLQFYLTRPLDGRAHKTLTHPRFRAGYDFLLIRKHIYPLLAKRADWWTAFQAAPPTERQDMIPDAKPTAPSSPRKPHRRKPAADQTKRRPRRPRAKSSSNRP